MTREKNTHKQKQMINNRKLTKDDLIFLLKYGYLTTEENELQNTYIIRISGFGHEFKFSVTKEFAIGAEIDELIETAEYDINSNEILRQKINSFMNTVIFKKQIMR